MNCLIYLRVSTKEQAQTNEKEGFSIAAQREACVKYIEDKGWSIADEYTDRGESAKSSNRPQLQEMLSRIKKDKTIDAVVVHKIDRLARNMEDHVAIKAILRRAGVVLVSMVENIEDSASGRLVEGIHALMAEFYSANLATEIKKGMGQMIKEGGWPYKAPLGYLNSRDFSFARRGRSVIAIDKEKAPIIQAAFNIYAQGNASVDDIRHYLYDNDIKCKYGTAPLSKSATIHLLNNRFYIGEVRWQDVFYPAKHPAIIDKDVFYKVREVMDANQTAGVRTRTHDHYLKGSLYCGECGRRLSVDTAKKKYTYFYCLGQKNQFRYRDKKCREKYVSAESIERELERLYETIELNPDWVAHLKTTFEQEMVKRQSTNTEQEQFFRKKLVKLGDEKLKLMRAYYAGAITLDLLKTEQERISSDMALAEQKIRSLSNNAEQATKVIDMAIKMASKCGYAYKKARPKTRKLFNQAFFKGIYIKDKAIYKVEYTELFGALFSKSSNKTELVGPAGFEPATRGL